MAPGLRGLAGRVALVTGGAAGIGRAIAERLAREGADVAILDRAPAAATVAAVEALGRRALALRADVALRAEVEAAVLAVEQRLGPIEVLVNNAGIARLGGVLDTSPEDWRASFAVNVDGCFWCCRAVVPAMLARRRGAVVNLASWLGKVAALPFGTYAATKFAVVALTQSLALETASGGVRVNAVCPGLIEGTAMRAEVERAGAAFGLAPTAERARAIPLGRAGTVEEVAALVAFLASEEASYMTGLAIPVAGGAWLL